MALRTDDISINTISGKGSAISGNMKVNGFIRIDGDIDGSLETDGNVIWKSSKFASEFASIDMNTFINDLEKGVL